MYIDYILRQQQPYFKAEDICCTYLVSKHSKKYAKTKSTKTTSEHGSVLYLSTQQQARGGVAPGGGGNT